MEDFSEVRKVMEEIHRDEEKAKLTPYSWGGRLEEFYEDICCKLNVVDSDQFEILLGLINKIEKEHPSLRPWAYKNVSMNT